MNLSQPYFELAEDTNIENFIILTRKKEGSAKVRALLHLITQMDSNSKYIKIPTFISLILGCCDYLTPYMFLVPLT